MEDKLLNISQNNFSEESILEFIESVLEISIEKSNWAIYCYDDLSNCGFYVFCLDKNSPHFAIPHGLDMNGVIKETKNPEYYSYNENQIVSYIENFERHDVKGYSWNFISEETAKMIINILYNKNKLRKS